MRPEEKYPIEPHIEKAFWNGLKDSPAQHILHNAIADEIGKTRDAYEDADPTRLQALQAHAKALKLVSAILNRADNRDLNPKRKRP